MLHSLSALSSRLRISFSSFFFKTSLMLFIFPIVPRINKLGLIPPVKAENPSFGQNMPFHRFFNRLFVGSGRQIKFRIKRVKFEKIAMNAVAFWRTRTAVAGFFEIGHSFNRARRNDRFRSEEHTSELQS